MVYDGHVMDERGRGLGFIELLMDDVSINPSPEGTVIRFAKRLGG
jgi:anti-sigma regulatory factor (Ser/Thr protein kinase)